MTKLQKSRIRGAFKTMVKAIADYEKAVAEVWAIDNNPRYFVEVFIFIRDEESVNISDSTLVDSKEEAEELLKTAKAFADKAIGGIEHGTTYGKTFIECSYHTADGDILGDFYVYFKEAV